MNSKAYRYAIKLLGKQDYSEKKLWNKMFSKEYSSQEIDNAIRLLKEKNYLNEERLINHQIVKLISKGYAPRLIQILLEKTNVSASFEQIEIWIEESYKKMNITPEGQVKKIVMKRQRENEKGDDKKKMRLLRHLISRGHEREICEAILDIDPCV